MIRARIRVDGRLAGVCKRFWGRQWRSAMGAGGQADGDHGVGIEAAVGPHGELSPGPSMAHPPHRLPQEVGGAPGGVGSALTHPGHQHVAGAGGDGQQRVIAPGAGVAVVAGALLG